MLPQQNRESEFINAQLIETEQNLIHERQQVLKAMNSAGQAKKENEQLRKLVQTGFKIFFILFLSQKFCQTFKTRILNLLKANSNSFRPAKTTIRERIRGRDETKSGAKNVIGS